MLGTMIAIGVALDALNSLPDPPPPTRWQRIKFYFRYAMFAIPILAFVSLAVFGLVMLALMLL